MKKNIGKFILLLLLFTFGLETVYASNDSEMESRVKDGTATLVCTYGTSDMPNRVKMYFRYPTSEQKISGWDEGFVDGWGPWVVFVAKKGSSELDLINWESKGTFKMIFNGRLMSYGEKGVAFPDGYDDEFKCPAYVNINYNDGGKLCFSEEQRCKDQGSIYQTNYPLSNSNEKEQNENKDATTEETVPKKQGEQSNSNKEQNKVPFETPDKNRELDDFSHNCQDFHKILRLIGYLIIILKILLPLAIIFKSSLNLYKVVTSGNADNLKKEANKLLYSLISGIAIFFIPTIINLTMGMIKDYNDGMNTDAKICRECIFNPYGETCSSIPD